MGEARRRAWQARIAVQTTCAVLCSALGSAIAVSSRGVLYLFDLGCFERALFASAKAAGSQLLMRLKSAAKVQVMGHVSKNGFAPLPGMVARLLPDGGLPPTGKSTTSTAIRARRPR